MLRKGVVVSVLVHLDGVGANGRLILLGDSCTGEDLPTLCSRLDEEASTYDGALKILVGPGETEDNLKGDGEGPGAAYGTWRNGDGVWTSLTRDGVSCSGVGGTDDVLVGDGSTQGLPAGKSFTVELLSRPGDGFTG